MVALTLLLTSVLLSWRTERLVQQGLNLQLKWSVYTLIDLLPYGVALLVALGLSQDSPIAAGVYLVLHAGVLMIFGTVLAGNGPGDEKPASLKRVIALGLESRLWRMGSFITTIYLTVLLVPILGLISAAF